MGLGRDKHLKLVKPLSDLCLSTTATHPIKVTGTAPSDSESTRDVRKELESQKTGKVTAVATVMTVFKKIKGSLHSATKKSSYSNLNRRI
jgi:hypothetical protein